jgi:2-C-methyl-D-erythritol 2,4-cyclodiphosphate synthase
MIRTGIGYDSHRFADGRALILGGQRIPWPQGLMGHSDADAVAHALTDALLGAAGAGDIGKLFPDKDPRWQDADSLVLLRLAVDAIRAQGAEPRQADITVICEGPRIGPYASAMAGALADAIGVAPSMVSVKGKSNEGMGWIGRGEGVAVIAVAIVEAR